MKDDESSTTCRPSGAAFVHWLCKLRAAFGLKLMASLMISQGLLKGVCGGGGNAGLAGVPIEFLLREYNVEASSLQVYKSAVLIPWAIKPLMGLLSDTLPLARYHRRPYFGIVALLGAVSYTTIPSVPGMPLDALLLLLFFIFFQIAMSDLLTEAVYSSRLRDRPAHGPDLISFIWGSIAVGKLFAVSIVGALISRFGARAPYAVCIPFALLALFIPIMNLIEEKPSPHRCCAKKAGAGDHTLTAIALLTGFGALGLSALSVLGSSLDSKIVAAVSLAVLVLLLFSSSLAPVVAKINAFFFIQHFCNFGVDGAAFYFFTDREDQYPEGPHFSILFYTTVLGLASTAFSLIGMLMYTRYMKHWRYPRVLVVGNVLASSVGLVSSIVYLRWNLILGISDRFFVLVSSAVSTVVFELAWLPGMLIISQLCPEGREATMFALLAGAGNLGSILGGYFGATMLHFLGVEPRGLKGESAQFDRLWLAALISALGPCLPLCLLRWLIPNVSQQDRMEGLGNATDGSLLSRICGWSTTDGADARNPAKYARVIGRSDSDAEPQEPAEEQHIKRALEIQQPEA